MFNSIVTLEHFICSVPVCSSSTTDLNTVLAILHSGAQESLVIVSDRGKPLGMIGCTQLLKYFLEQLRIKSVIDANVLQNDWRGIETLMTPLLCLPAQITLSELGMNLINEHLELADFPSYAVVDYRGKFLGLLDQHKLLRYLFSQQTNSFHLNLDNNSQVIRQFLLKFLEQLPFPLNLITEKGKVIYQNQLWYQQLGESVYPALTDSQFTSQALVSMACGLSSENNPSLSPSEAVLDDNSLAVKILTRSLATKADLPLIYPPKLPHSFSPWENEENLINYPWKLVKVPLDFSAVDILDEPLWLIIAIDKKEQQDLCQELAIKNSDLIQLNRLKDELFTYISHELKSPITSVIGLSSLLKEQKLGLLSKRQANYAQLIYQSGRHLMTLVNDMLDLTPLQTGELKLHITSVDITSVCQQAYQLLLDKYQEQTETRNSFNLEIASDLKVIQADEIRLRQMLFHLLDNAIKLAEVDGKIGLKVNQCNQWLAFTVWDTGPGIPEQFQSLIFEQYQVQENSWTGPVNNIGLRLLLIQRLAKAHGGDISFISRQRKGNQFTILMPLNSVKGKTIDNTFSRNCQPLILVVESLPAAIENLTDLLNRLGYSAIIARTGTDGLAKARKLKPEMIFLNPLLPLLSGWDLLKLVKSDPYIGQIPVIVTSSALDQQYAEANGGDHFLTLPVEKSALQTILPPISPTVFPHNPSKTNSSDTFFPPGSELMSVSVPPATNRYPLTILRLHSTVQYQTTSISNSPLEQILKAKLSQLNYHLLEADNLDQAEMIANVWDIDVVVLDDYELTNPVDYIQSLCQCESLATLPLVTLEAKTTEIANRIGQLAVFPCLISSQDLDLEPLLKVIEIAAQTKSINPDLR
jgi:signal transduction histidine kinase/CheY-like chemotaxis protein